MFYSLDICWYTCSESEWMDQGVYYEKLEDAFGSANALLDEGYCVKLVKHDGDFNDCLLPWKYNPECDDQIMWVNGHEFIIAPDNNGKFSVSQVFRDETGELYMEQICTIDEKMTIQDVKKKIIKHTRDEDI